MYLHCERGNSHPSNCQHNGCCGLYLTTGIAILTSVDVINVTGTTDIWASSAVLYMRLERPVRRHYLFLQGEMKDSAESSYSRGMAVSCVQGASVCDRHIIEPSSRALSYFTTTNRRQALILKKRGGACCYGTYTFSHLAPGILLLLGGG